MKTYEVWKSKFKYTNRDRYYVVVHKTTPYSTRRGFQNMSIKLGDEFIQAGFKSYEAALDFIQVLQKLKGINN